MSIHTANTPRPSHEDRARRPLQVCEPGPPIIVPAILEGMSQTQAAAAPLIDIAAVQTALAADGIDGWLLYDFRGLNPIAVAVTHLDDQSGHLATRRWFYLIPATGEPRGLVHAIEKNCLAHLPGATEWYAGRQQLEVGLKRLLAGVRRVAMEYSPACAIPYVARVDAGTVELVRQSGADVGS